jgi:hypothetical protein
MGLAVGVDLDVQAHGVAADGAIFHVVLVGTGGDVYGNDDLFAAGIADIAGLLVG